MPPCRTVLASVVLAVAMSACGDAAVSPTSTATASATATPVASSPAATAAASQPGSPATSDDTTGGAFTCDLPIVESGSVPIANIVDVRVGAHGGHDRLVFEFEQGTPAFTLERAEPPFVEDGSGLPIEVEGQAFLGLVMRGGTKQTDAGTSSYDGPTEFRTGFEALVHAVEAGDFERQSTWILGLEEAACVRVALLDEPPRLVIDVAH